jgi:hypothetical protein
MNRLPGFRGASLRRGDPSPGLPGEEEVLRRSRWSDAQHAGSGFFGSSAKNFEAKGYTPSACGARDGQEKCPLRLGGLRSRSTTLCEEHVLR